jgi:hypothetical protein
MSPFLFSRSKENSPNKMNQFAVRVSTVFVWKSSLRSRTNSENENLVVMFTEAPKLLGFIQEVLVWNLGWDTEYTGCGLSWFSSVIPVKFRESIMKINPIYVPTKSFSVHYLLLSYSVLCICPEFLAQHLSKLFVNKCNRTVVRE